MSFDIRSSSLFSGGPLQLLTEESLLMLVISVALGLLALQELPGERSRRFSCGNCQLRSY